MTLGELIESKKGEIIARWSERVRPPLAVGSLGGPALIDSLPEFLDELVLGIRQGIGGRPLAEEGAGTQHGHQRFTLGFDLKEMVREYGLLHDVLFHVMMDSGYVPGLEELYRMSLALDAGIVDAVAEFVRARDQSLDEQASEHLAFLAHELRNPLTSVQLALETLRPHVPPARIRSVEAMGRGLSQATELIDSQLVELRLRAGSTPQFESLDVRSFLEEAIVALAPNIESREQTLVLEADDGIPLEGDVRLLKSVLRNLIGNAVKFSPEGGTITVRGSCIAGRVIFEVEDQCGGLPEGLAGKMFSPFSQYGRDRSGHGLGLAIARQAVEAHSGSIRVHDFPGRGCNFIVDLPPKPPKPPGND